MKFIFDMQINIKVFYNLMVPFWVCVSRHAQCTQNNTFAISLQYTCNISRKTWKIKLIFHLQINVKGFFKLLLSCAKYLHILRKSSHVGCYLLLFRTSIYDAVIVAWQLKHHCSWLWSGQCLNHICWHWSTSLSNSLIRHTDFLKFSFSEFLKLPLGIHKRYERVF